MSDIDALPQSKTHKGENFPVASRLIAAKHRGPILAYYRFARGADDIADSPVLSPDEKLRGLDAFEETLLGRSEVVAAAKPLRDALAAHGLSSRHAQDLLTAFRLDVTKKRYRNWDDLIDYCTYSAMPVGRFVLDVHGESRATWPASDALCAALQVINHLQDCGKDYRQLDRVYVPLDALAREGIAVEALAAGKASPELRRCLRSLAERTSAMLRESESLPAQVRDLRLALEISVIERLARRLTKRLMDRDPLSERVHLNSIEVAGTSAVGAASALAGRIFRRFVANDNTQRA